MGSDRGASVGNGNSNSCGNSSYNGPPASVDGVPLNEHWWYLV